ncbi:hypothetical protein GCM10009753_51400 [Streptantibioticus ferralitis]
MCVPKRPGHPPTIRSMRALVPRLARESSYELREFERFYNKHRPHGTSSKWHCAFPGTPPARKTRSAQVKHGLGFARRSTATLCRSTSSWMRDYAADRFDGGGSRAIAVAAESPNRAEFARCSRERHPSLLNY